MVDKNISFLAVYHGDNEFTIVSAGLKNSTDFRVAFLQLLRASILNPGPKPSGLLIRCFFNSLNLNGFRMIMLIRYYLAYSLLCKGQEKKRDRQIGDKHGK